MARKTATTTKVSSSSSTAAAAAAAAGAEEEPAAVVLFAEPVPDKPNKEIPTIVVSAETQDPNYDDDFEPSKDFLGIAASTASATLVYLWNSFLWLLVKEWFQDILSYTCLICAFALVFLDPIPPYGRFSGVALSWLVFICTKFEEDRRRRIRDEKERLERRERRKREAEEKERLEKEQQEQQQKLDRQHSAKKIDRQQQSAKKIDRQHNSGRRRRR